MADPALIERRLHVVVGKGGVGKTTVAASLARLLADRGRRTLAVELDVGGRLCGVFGVGEAVGAPVRVDEHLSVQSVDGRAALEEYLGLIIPVKRLLATVFANRIYQYFVAAAPGLKELMTVGKIWYEATREERGRPAWDAIVVDAPATGHSLQYLRMPQAARDTFGTGLVQREATKIVQLFQDASTTAVHLVTLAEEMPVSETLETYVQLRDVLRMPVGWVVVNRVHRRRFAPTVVEALEQAAARLPAGERALIAHVAERANEESGWATINAANLARLRTELGPDLPLVELPFLFVEEFGREALSRLSSTLASGVADDPAALRRRS